MDDRDQFEQMVATVRGELLHAIQSNPTARENTGATVLALAEITLNLGLQSLGRKGTADLFHEAIRAAAVPQ